MLWIKGSPVKEIQDLEGEIHRKICVGINSEASRIRSEKKNESRINLLIWVHILDISYKKKCYLDFLRVIWIIKTVDKRQIECWPKINEIESPDSSI